MCIAAPGEVIEIKGHKALVKYPGDEIRQAMIMDIKPKVGNFVLVQMGIIIEVIDKKSALKASKAWTTNALGAINQS
jgi:hydrogenase expression/formation protein HypC